MFVVGLTGGIGSGKSVAAAFFQRQGIKVVDADSGSRAVVMPGMPALKAIADRFGAGILGDDGSLDRAALRKIVFDDNSERHWLEQLLHPLIGEWIANELASAPGPYCILESPLLLETHQRQMVDRVLVVDVPEDIQVARAMDRDNNPESQIRAIIAAQMPRAERNSRADDVADNSGTIEDLEKQLTDLHRRYLAMSQNKT